MRLSAVDVQLAFLVLFFFGSALVSAYVDLNDQEYDLLKKLLRKLNVVENDYPERWEELADKFYAEMRAALPLERRHMQPFRTPFQLAQVTVAEELASFLKKTYETLQSKEGTYQAKKKALKAEAKAEADALKAQAASVPSAA